MPTNVGLVSALLCCIVLVVNILGTDGATSSLLVQVLVKTSSFGGITNTTSQGSNDCGEVPKDLNLNLNFDASLGIITATWAQQDPSCFPGAHYRVTSTGHVDEIVPGNDYVVDVLSCYTNYDVTVSLIDEAGNDIGVPASDSVKTIDGNRIITLDVRAPSAKMLTASWSLPVDSSCFFEYQLSYSISGDEASKTVVETTDTKWVSPTLQESTEYTVELTLKDLNGQDFLYSPVQFKTTQFQYGYEMCVYPAITVSSIEGTDCAKVETPFAGSNISAGNDVCRAIHPSDDGRLYYYGHDAFEPIADLQAHLRFLQVTDELLVGGFYKDGGWKWGPSPTHYSARPVSPSLAAKLPQGGEGPEDFKMLFFDPAKDFELSAATDGHAFGGVICMYVKFPWQVLDSP